MNFRVLDRIAIFASLITLVWSNLQSQQFRVVGYYPMWSKAALPVSAIRYGSLTHINHAFAWPNTDGSISSNETAVDTNLINTTHRAGRKILLSFGGAGTTQTTNFSIVLADSGLRQTFVNNIASRLASYHYDGVDLDWEGPSSRSDRANEVLFVQQLKAAFEMFNPTWLITMAIGMSNYSGQWHDYSTLVLSVDWFNVMDYDVHGSWSSIAGHNAPLYPGNDPTSDPDYFSVDQSIQYLTITRSIPEGKLAMGLPFYGKSFGTTKLYTAFVGELDLAYRDIMNMVQSGDWSYAWDSGSQVPYYTSASLHTLVSLDDSASIALKCQCAISKGLGGVMIWELSQDVIGQKQPLMDVIGAQMMKPTGIIAQRPASVPSGLTLYDNYPNPFNPSTTIRYELATNSFAMLRVYDLFGREMETLVNEFENKGVWVVRFDASQLNLSSGVYFYRLEAGGFTQTKRFVLIK